MVRRMSHSTETIIRELNRLSNLDKKNSFLDKEDRTYLAIVYINFLHIDKKLKSKEH